MSIWNKLFGKSGVTASADIPWDYSSAPPTSTSLFLSKHQDVIRHLFKSYGSRVNDPIVLLVAYEQSRWRGLMHLLYQKKEKVPLSPETFTRGDVQAENIGNDCWVYAPPTIQGQKLQTGIYVAERGWVVSEMCRIDGVDMLFLQMVRDERTPGTIPVVVLTASGMGVQKLPVSVASLPESSAQVAQGQPKDQISRLSTPARQLKAKLADGMPIEQVHGMFGEPHVRNEWKLLGCDYHEVWNTIEGRLRVFYIDKKVEKWAVEG